MGKMEKVFEKMLKKMSKMGNLADVAIKQLEMRKQQGLMSKEKADLLIKDIKDQRKKAEEEQK